MEFTHDGFKILKYPIIAVGKGNYWFIYYGFVVKSRKVVERAGMNKFLYGIFNKAAWIRLK